MIFDAANAHTVIDAFQFIGDHPGFLATKAWEQLELAGAALGVGLLVAITVVATAPIAAIAGGGGLGDVIVNQASYRLEGVIGASFCVMALSAGVWLALLALQKAMTPRPVRLARVFSAGDERKELL